MTKNQKSFYLQEVQVKIEQYCAYQDRCVYDVKQKLKTFDLCENEIIFLIEELTKQKFIDEERYAASYTRGSYRFKKWGWNKIKVNLISKKISDYHINLAFQEIDQQEYYTMISHELSKKWPSINGKSDFDKKNKLIRFGISRGYEYDIINDLIHDIVN